MLSNKISDSLWLYLGILEYVVLYITTVVVILRKEIIYSHLLVYPKEYSHGFICFVVFILRIHIALK